MPGDFTFPHSLNDTVYYPDVPADGTAARQQFMDLFNAIKDNMNNDLAQSTDVSGLAGAGRTTETVKGNADALSTHLAENAQDAHGGINAGTANIDIQDVFTYQLPIDTRNLNPTSWDTENRPTTIEVRDGVTVISTIGITYNANGKITQLVETCNGKTVTVTQTFDATTGKFTGRTRTVV